MSMSMIITFALTQKIIDVFLVLNPKEKMSYFKKHWSVNLQEAVVKCVEEVVCENSPLHFSR
jgi:hypothetical protein